MTFADLPLWLQDAGRDLQPSEAAAWRRCNKRTLTRAADRGELKLHRGRGGRSQTVIARLELLRWHLSQVGA